MQLMLKQVPLLRMIYGKNTKKNPTVIKRGTPAIGRELTADGLVTDLSQQPNSGIVHAGPAGTFKVER